MKHEPLTQGKLKGIAEHATLSDSRSMAQEILELRRLINVPGKLAGIPCEMPTKLLLDTACKELLELRRDRERLANRLRDGESLLSEILRLAVHLQTTCHSTFLTIGHENRIRKFLQLLPKGAAMVPKKEQG